MDPGIFQWGQFITLFMVASAIGMDAFSLGVGVGMVGMGYRDILKVSVTIGSFHVLMPLAGIVFGIYLSDMVGDIAVLIGGSVLIILGAHMCWNALFGKEKLNLMKTTGFGLLMFAFSVSLDALSVGFSYGLMERNVYMAVILFGMMGGLMAGVGLLLGKYLGGWLGGYSELLGGVILLIFGIKFVW